MSMISGYTVKYYGDTFEQDVIVPGEEGDANGWGLSISNVTRMSFWYEYFDINLTLSIPKR